MVARAALLLECAHFVNRCNRGEWPNWMKLNIAGFRHTGLLNSRCQPSGYRRNLLLQRAAGKLFHQWGEVHIPFMCNKFDLCYFHSLSSSKVEKIKLYRVCIYTRWI